MTAVDTHETERFEIAPDIEQWPPEAVLQWSLDKFAPKLALACSLQAEESVLIDMMHRIAGSKDSSVLWGLRRGLFSRRDESPGYGARPRPQSFL